MNRAEWLSELQAAQAALRALVAELDEAQQRRQYHPDISPLGWHLGHCTFVELYWLRERVEGDDQHSRHLHELYFPELAPKPGRAGRLPPRAELLDWAQACHGATAETLAEPPEADAHPLPRDDYLLKFLVQHHCQHLETMELGLCQRALARPAPGLRLAPAPPADDWVELPAGEYRLGSDRPWVYDNEGPPLTAHLARAQLAARPVSNAEYAGFLAAGGYRRRELWSAEGWRWRQDGQIDAPQGWHQGRQGYRLHPAQGGTPAEPVRGISYFEAEAYARWAGARLPHEHEWEAAERLGLLEGGGEVWEWCGNAFHPYPGFRPYPYDGYSLPWFDARHQTLRGASRHTRRCIRRPSFRNFYERDKRHISAGLRLAR